jgi:AcrR family transcriptional regulator
MGSSENHTDDPPVRRRSRVGTSDQRWREIVDAAALVFQQKGYEAATTADIAEKVGMLKGSLYYYIESKEDLLFAIIQEVHDVFLAIEQETRELPGDPASRLRHFVEGHVANNARESVRSTVFHREFHALSPLRRAFIVSERDNYDHFLRELVAQGQAAKVFCPDLDPKMTAIGMLGMMNHVYQWYRPGGRLTPEEVGQKYADLLLGALVCTPRGHTPGHRTAIGAVKVLAKGKGGRQ